MSLAIDISNKFDEITELVEDITYWIEETISPIATAHFVGGINDEQRTVLDHLAIAYKKTVTLSDSIRAIRDEIGDTIKDDGL
jgi:hypothetical protein